MQAVIFDLDGTIVDSHPTHFAAYEKLFGEFGITWTYEEFNAVFLGIGARAIIQSLLTRHGVKDFDLDFLVQRKRDFFDEFLAHKKLEVVPGFFDFLKEINTHGLKKIIASGSHTDNIWSMLRNIGADSEFAQITSVEEVKNPKPAPDIFLLAAQKISTAPAECLVIEDTVHGVGGAKAAGMKCIALTTTTSAEKLKESDADWIFPDYTQISFKIFGTIS